MKIVKEANTMTIFLMKKLYIDNAEQVEKELFDAVENIHSKQIVAYSASNREAEKYNPDAFCRS